MLKPLAIIQLGEPPEPIFKAIGQQSDWFIDALPPVHNDIKIFRPDMGEKIPSSDNFSGAILTGSWAMVTDLHPWSESTAEWIRSAHSNSLPLLGVCFGHQLIAHALGGRVGDNPTGRECGLHLIELSGDYQNDPLLKDMPKRLSAWLSHQQTILEAPQGANILAFSTQDSCQIIRYSGTTFSVQFHPEFSLDVMLACLWNNEVIDHLPDGKNLPTWPRLILQRFYNYYCTVPKCDFIH